MNRENAKKLFSFQDKIDKQYKIFSRNDFLLKLSYYNGLKPVLKERDDLINDLTSEGINFWEIASKNFKNFENIFPSEDFFIESLNVFLEENFICGVEIIISRNKYLSNRKLIKKFNLFENNSDGTELKVKKEYNCLLFEFFRDSDNDLEVFDVLFELYVNAAQYFFRNE